MSFLLGLSIKLGALANIFTILSLMWFDDFWQLKRVKGLLKKKKKDKAEV